jgi:hypothetical protein
VIDENEWRKSSFCPNGSGCVEVAFHKATASAPNGSCVEVGECDCDAGTIYVRDSKDQGGPVLRFTRAEWVAFLAGVNAGEFDHSTA